MFLVHLYLRRHVRGRERPHSAYFAAGVQVGLFVAWTAELVAIRAAAPPAVWQVARPVVERVAGTAAVASPMLRLAVSKSHAAEPEESAH